MNVIDRIADLSILWKQASMIFPYFEKGDLDWDETYREFLPKVMEAEDERAFHLLLAEFMNRLGDGHTDYLFPKAMLDQNGYLPFSLRYIGGRYYLQGIQAGDEAYLLSEVQRINGTAFDELLAKVFRYIYHVGNYAYSNKLNQILPFFLRKTGNEMVTDKGIYRFNLAEEKTELVEYGVLRTSGPAEDMRDGKLDIRLYNGNILYARMDDCLYKAAADEIAAAIKRVPMLKGVILDLRENIGGMTMFGAEVAKLFISGSCPVCKKKTRLIKGIDVAVASQMGRMTAKEMEEAVKKGSWERGELEKLQKISRNSYCEEYCNEFGTPDHQPLAECPCVILTSRNTISAAEDVVAMFLGSGHRATIMGTPTHGSTGTPMLLKLSGGGRVRICSVGYELMDGTEFIGIGIQPDIRMENGIEDLREGRDKVLEAAIDFLDV